MRRSKHTRSNHHRPESTKRSARSRHSSRCCRHSSRRISTMSTSGFSACWSSPMSSSKAASRMWTDSTRMEATRRRQQASWRKSPLRLLPWPPSLPLLHPCPLHLRLPPPRPLPLLSSLHRRASSSCPTNRLARTGRSFQQKMERNTSSTRPPARLLGQ